MYLTCITITQSTIITSPIGFNIGLTNVDARLKQRCINVVQRCFDVVSTSGTDAVSTLCNVENPTSDFVSFSTSDQCYFNVEPKCWSKVDPTLKCWLEYEHTTLIEVQFYDHKPIASVSLWLDKHIQTRDRTNK